MKKSYLNATPNGAKWTVDRIRREMRGNRYGIPQYAIVPELYVGCPVVFIDRIARRQIEGKLTLLEELPGDYAGNWQRYNVHVRDLEEVPFTDAEFLHTGVAWY